MARACFAVLEGGANGRVVKRLARLRRVEIDLLHAYRRALRHVTDAAIARRVVRHMDEHERHVVALERAIHDVGGELPWVGRSIKGRLIAGFVALRSLTGTAGALVALKGNEDLAQKHYARALADPHLPLRVRQIVKALQRDLKAHADYVVGILRDMEPEPA